MKKKVLCLLTVLVMTFVVTMLAACNGGKEPEDNGSSPPEPQEITVTIDESLSVNLFESAKLTAITNSEQDVTYTSSDTSVLTVEATSGAIVPQKAGTATVTASVEGKSAACVVTVVAPDSDDITFVAINKEVKLKKGITATLEVQAFWGDKELDGFSIAFESDDPGVVAVDAEGVLTGVNIGTAKITVSGTLKGVSLGSDTVSVEVSEDVTVSADVQDLTLYTSEGEDTANPLITSHPLAVTVTIDGKEEQQPEFVVQSSDEAIVKYENGELVAKGKKGTAKVTVSYTSESGTCAQDTINVTVLYPIKEIDVPDSVIAGANRGEIVYSPEFTAVNADKAYIEGEEYPVTIDDSGNIKVEISEVPASDMAITIKAVVDSADTTYEISLTAIVYDFLIGDAGEFRAFANAFNANDYVYARLTANVDMENTAVVTANNAESGLGTVVSFSLDGAGFSVLNLYTDAEYGAFAACVGKNAAGKNTVIKNVAFANYINQGNKAGLFYEIANVSFENFYLSSSVNFFNGGMVAVRDMGNVTYQNCVVYCFAAEDPNRTETANFCKIGGLTSEGVPNTQKNYTDTYAVNPVASKMILGSVHTVQKYQPWETEADAKDYEVDDGVTMFTDGLYKSWTEFATAHPVLPENFDSEIWKINADGELVFKTMPEPEKPAFDYRAAITGEYGEELFKPVSDDNSVTWVQNDYGYVYKFTNNVTAQDDTRGFYLDFDYMNGLKELGATQISFTLISGSEDAPNGTKYFSFATGPSGAGWWDAYTSNLGNTVWGWYQDVTIDLSNAPEGSSLWILFDTPGDFFIRNIRITYPTTKQAIAVTEENLSAENNTVGANQRQCEFTTSGPSGETGNYFYAASGGWSGNKLTFDTPVDFDGSMILLTVKVYASANTSINFYYEDATENWTTCYDVKQSLTAQTWTEITLVIDGYVGADGKISGIQFVSENPAEIWISEINILSIASAT